MKRFLFAVLAFVLAIICSCSKDGAGSPEGSSESTAIAGSPETVISITDTGSHSEGSAFMYKSAQTLYFLLCEGKANSWNAGIRLPHLEVHIWEALVKDDPMAFANPANAIDINGSDPKVYVCWKAGNGHNFFDKNNYAVAQGVNYTFESGSLNVAKVMGMYMIAFNGFCADEIGAYSPGWSYSGSFTYSSRK